LVDSGESAIAKRRGQLVRKHLENVSGEVLEKHRELIAGHARGQQGVYALYDGDSMYYVGLATNLSGRLRQHLRDKHRGKWDRFSMYLTRNDRHLRELEALLHRVVRPQGNRQMGRLAGSIDLRQVLKRQVREEYRKQEVGLFGERVRAVRETHGGGAKAASIEGLVDRAMTLKGWYKGYEYTARARKNGTIRWNGKVYETPSEAARAARGRATNGWVFWWFKNRKGEWVRLRELKG
jgi:hypothetical protein